MRTPGKRLRAINGNGDGGNQNNLFDKAVVTVLEDGRVEATISKLTDDGDEIIARTSQKKAAGFIFNDLAPVVAADANKVTPFGGQ